MALCKQLLWYLGHPSTTPSSTSGLPENPPVPGVFSFKMLKHMEMNVLHVETEAGCAQLPMQAGEGGMCF